MKRAITILYLGVLIICLSCGKTTKKQNDEKIVSDTSIPKKLEQQKEEITSNDTTITDITGFYVGRFVAVSYGKGQKPSYINKINISIDKIIKDSIFGHSVVAGNNRPFKGTFDHEKKYAKVLEPGDNKYDGIFEFSLISEKDEIEGVWIANNQNLAVSKREYHLTKMKFEYQPENNLIVEEGYEYSLSLYENQERQMGEQEAIDPQRITELNASTEELTSQDLENLRKGELEILRNLIYARHGYSFKNRKMRYFFDTQVDWYIPVSTDVRKKLTDIEQKNISLIKRYEQHAKRYYDYFGR